MESVDYTVRKTTPQPINGLSQLPASLFILTCRANLWEGSDLHFLSCYKLFQLPKKPSWGTWSLLRPVPHHGILRDRGLIRRALQPRKDKPFLQHQRGSPTACLVFLCKRNNRINIPSIYPLFLPLLSQEGNKLAESSVKKSPLKKKRKKKECRIYIVLEGEKTPCCYEKNRGHMTTSRLRCSTGVLLPYNYVIEADQLHV